MIINNNNWDNTTNWMSVTIAVVPKYIIKCQNSNLAIEIWKLEWVFLDEYVVAVCVLISSFPYFLYPSRQLENSKK